MGSGRAKEEERRERDSENDGANGEEKKHIETFENPEKELDVLLTKMGFEKYLQYPEITSKKYMWTTWMQKGFTEEVGMDVQRLIYHFVLW